MKVSELGVSRHPIRSFSISSPFRHRKRSVHIGNGIHVSGRAWCEKQIERFSVSAPSYPLIDRASGSRPKTGGAGWARFAQKKFNKFPLVVANGSASAL
jgi:hypothetical protein